MATLLARAFAGVSRGWSAAEITTLLDSPHIFMLSEPNAFVLGRVVTDEAEILTIAADPDAQRQGTARRLLADFEVAAVDRGATRVFLEVAADNKAAIALYDTAGYDEIARRAAYYDRTGSGRVDALIFEKSLI